ncbi:MAG: DUF3160 domain-containing protein [Acidimicrobiia bacterium]|nr:DUF3160 domain-containing protein [Acidimicrobiia bacterium]MDH3396576.1 DUF3160 domain-containing protein [Acidimicrobiia bacterium]
MKRVLIVLIVLAMITAACTDKADETTTTGSATTSTTLGPSTTTTVEARPPAVVSDMVPGSPGAFASFDLIPLLDDGSVYPGPSLPETIDAVLKPEWLTLAPDVAAALLAQGFVIVPDGYRQFQHAYASYLYEGQVFFVTTDAGYHFLHLVFSKLLRDIEQDTLLPILEELVLGLVAATREQTIELDGSDLAEPAARAQQAYEATATLLELDIGPIGPLAEQEVELALEASQLTASPTTSFGECLPSASLINCVDYSLFKPRGHYTRNADLERYFRAMSMLGQASFFVHDADSLRVGVLASRPLVQNPKLAEAWRLVYEPTAFMVGVADDYTPLELAATAEGVVEGWLDNPAGFADSGPVDDLAEGLAALRPVGIDPENASVRIMGVRFVLDSYVYDQLRFPNVGDPPFGRVYATTLDLAAVFGSDLAYRELEAAGETEYANYETQFAAMQDLVDDRSAGDWAGTVYDAWLYALQPVLVPHGAAYPDFMRTPAWEAKGLQTGLGSYAELKHDTILFAKQSFAAEGGFEPMVEPPRHWVEPDPVAWERMRSVITLLQDGLRNRGLVGAGDDSDALMTSLEGWLERLAGIARDELVGVPISLADNDWLEGIGSVLEALWIQSSDWDDALGLPSADDTDAALIADIMRSTVAYLEIGTGRIDRIMVLVPNDSGRFQVAVGGVYSYYEFWQDADLGRLTDEEWRAMLDGGEAPKRPGWQSSLFGGGTPPPAAGLAGGLFCRDVEAAGHTFEEALAYWVREGRPSRMDADRNGVPCETVYTAGEVQSLLGSAGGYEPDLFCYHLADRGASFGQAVVYWVREGAPDRMDADGNGLPCETVYDPGEIAGFIWFDR